MDHISLISLSDAQDCKNTTSDPALSRTIRSRTVCGQTTADAGMAANALPEGLSRAETARPAELLHNGVHSRRIRLSELWHTKRN